MEIGQPELSERETQRSELFVTPTNVYSKKTLHVNDYD
jgi:hypothetical protein